MPPIAPRRVIMTPAMTHAHEAQKCQFVILGFLTTSQKMEGREYVVGPNPRAPMKPSRSAAQYLSLCVQQTVSAVWQKQGTCIAGHCGMLKATSMMQHSNVLAETRLERRRASSTYSSLQFVSLRLSESVKVFTSPIQDDVAEQSVTIITIKQRTCCKQKWWHAWKKHDTSQRADRCIS